MALNLNISGPQKSEYSPEVGEIFGTNRGLPASSTQLAGMELGPIETQVQQYEASITDRLGEIAQPDERPAEPR